MVPSSEISLKRCRTLLEKYSDLPMDFADATLVVLAEELNANKVFRFDSAFQIYRIRGRKHFQIVPATSNSWPAHAGHARTYAGRMSTS